MKKTLLFCKKHKYKTTFLWTTSELSAARYLYTSVGFRKIQEKTHEIWGKKPQQIEQSSEVVTAYTFKFFQKR